MNLRRSNAIRTKVDHPQVPKSDDNLADDEGEAMVEGNSGEPIPNLSSIPAVHTEVQLDQRQYLHQVLPARTPVVPEAVHLGSRGSGPRPGIKQTELRLSSAQ